MRKITFFTSCSTLTKLNGLSFLWICLAVLSFFSSNAQPTTAEIYQLPEGVKLETLPLDTVLEKVGIALNRMTGTTDASIKQDLWKLLARAKTTKDPLYIAKVYQCLANWHYTSLSSEKADSIYFYDQKALMLLLQTGDKELISRAYRTVGMDLDELQQYAQAEIHYFKGLEIAEAIGAQKNINSIYAALSAHYSNMKDYDSAFKYNQSAIAAYEKEGNTYPLVRALLNQTNIYIELGEPEKALTTSNRVLKLIQDLPEEVRETETLNAITWRGRAYRSLGKYDEALADFEFSWKGLTVKYGAENTDGWKGDIGSIYFLQGKYAAAIPYFRDYLKHLADKKIYNSDDLKKHYLWLAESYEALNQTDSAYVYLKKGKDIEINILQQDVEALRKELRIKYETEQKDQTIQSQSSQIQQQQQIQWLSYGVGGLLTLLLGGLFFTYRNNNARNVQLQNLNKDLKTTNTKLDQRNEQNELLLKEIHHRVKNNLEIVSSLLELQSAQVEDENTQNIMQANQSRVQSMSIIHQKLYQGENLASIEMRTYFEQLGESLLDTFDASEQVTVECNMPEIELDVDTAVPIGLIVNELLTNSLKYAFPDNEKGIIAIQLNRKSANELYLQVADNGVGKPFALSPKGTGFGTQLVQLLTRQLNGTMQISSNDGMVTTFVFKPFAVY